MVPRVQSSLLHVCEFGCVLCVIIPMSLTNSNAEKVNPKKEEKENYLSTMRSLKVAAWRVINSPF